MRLAISNLAWPREAEAKVASLFRQMNVPGVEIAPTKVWPQPLTVSDREIWEYRKFWESRGIRIVALQSLLFGRPELQIFADPSAQIAMLAHLGGMCRLAYHLGAKALVFGSPKNRRRNSLSEVEAEAIAYGFFRRLGDIAELHGVTIGIEANPVQYQCDFLTRGIDAARFVERLAHPAIALHLDTACLALAGETPGPILNSFATRTCHLHISEPQLQPIHINSLPHEKIAGEIRQSRYAGWLSIEMQTPAGVFDPEIFERSLSFVQQRYLPAHAPSARAA